MTLRLTIIILFILVMISCEKDDSRTFDYRDSVTGEYKGIRVDTYWKNTYVGYGHDTSSVIINLSKSDLDSIIEISFKPTYVNEKFSFTYIDGTFISTTYYHPPTLTLMNDSLYFKHQAGLGPIWTECFATKHN